MNLNYLQSSLHRRLSGQHFPSLASLPNRLIEVAVIVGTDHMSGLTVTKNNNHDCDASEIRLSEVRFEPKLLGAISSQDALFPFRVPPRDPKYPPNEWQIKRAASVGSQDAAFSSSVSNHSESQSVHSLDDRSTTSDEFPANFRNGRRYSRKMSLAATLHYDYASVESSVIHTAPKLPIPLDVLHNVACLCFPDDIQVEFHAPIPSAHYLVLTDVEGNRTYAIGIKFYRAYVMWKHDSGNRWECYPQLSKSHTELEPGQYLVYLPATVVFISKFPYHNTIKDALSRAVSSIVRNPYDMDSILKNYALQLCMTPVPPPGNTVLKFPLDGALLTLHPPPERHRPLVDLSLKLVLDHFSSPDLVMLLSAVLTQQKIVLLSSNYGLLTLMSHSLLLMLEPFQWNAPYVPVLSHTMLELLEAPGSLLMGCHSKCIAQVNQVEGLLVANIDTGDVSVCPNMSMPDMPTEPACNFISACAKIRCQRDARHMGWLTPFSYEEMAELRQKRQQYFNQLIMDATCQLLVSLFRDVLQYVKVEQRFFNQDVFFDTLPPSYKPFYREVIGTQMFKSFLLDRFAQRTDRWSIMEEKTRPSEPEIEGTFRRIRSCSTGVAPWELRERTSSGLGRTVSDAARERTSSGLGRTVSDAADLQNNKSDIKRRSVTAGMTLPAQRPHSRRSVVGTQFPVQPSPRPRRSSSNHSTGSLEATTPEPEAIVMPMFEYEAHRIYYSKCIEMLASKARDSDDVELKWTCTYLQALLRVANNEPMRALQDCHALSAQNGNTIPKEVLARILASLPAVSQSQLESEDFRNSEEFRDLEQAVTAQDLDPPIKMHLHKLPHKDIGSNEFKELVQMLEIAMDGDTIKRLFQALTLDETNAVDADTFRVFYEAWKEVEMECCNFNVPGLHLDANECFIKVSTTLKTSHGTGRLALTQKRLFVLQEGSSEMKEVVKLRNIERLEKIQQRSNFLSQVPCLKVNDKDSCKPAFVAWLKEGRDSWYTLVQEMWCGKLMQEELREAGLIQQAALNVLLIDAVTRSGEDESCEFHHDVDKAVSFLTYFTRCWLEGIGVLAADTRDVLTHCVDPNIRELEKKAIETLLYMPGQQSCPDDEVDQGPKLWCGMGSGKIKVFDASTWLVETPHIQAKDRMVCLLAVGEEQIWAGSLDGAVYVIDSVTKTCTHRLHEHKAMVIDLILLKEKRLVLSAGIDGQLICWNTQTLQQVYELQVEDIQALRSVHYENNRFWCCHRDGIVQLSYEGEVLHRAEYKLGGTLMALDCMMMMPHGEVWCGCRQEGVISIWEAYSLQFQTAIPLECRGIGCMVRVQDKIWVGTKDGTIYIINMVTRDVEKKLKAHSDVIRSMCSAQTRYVMSGSGSQDGKIAIWRTSAA